MVREIRFGLNATILSGLLAAGFGCVKPEVAVRPKVVANASPTPARLTPPSPKLVPEKPVRLSMAAASHALLRLSFGVRPGQAEALAKNGLDAWLAEQLQPASLEDARGQLALEPFRDALAAPRDLPQKFSKLEMMGENLPGGKVDEQNINKMTDFGRLLAFSQMSQIVRQTESDRQLLEVMVDFWTNHFNVYARKGLVKLLAADYVERAIRPNALGSFQDLLLATARHPAMLVYLDNAQSSAPLATSKRGGKRGKRGGITENYARELLELHTLGVQGGYTQADVVDVARVLTGWSVERSGSDGPAFKFRASAHDRGEKLILGQVYPAGRGLEEGVELMARLANQPATAQHLARKLCARLVADEAPTGCVEQGAAAFLKSHGDIRKTLLAIVRSSDFSSEKYRLGKMKSPLEFMVSAIRVLDGKLAGDARRLAKVGEQLGEPLLVQAVPTGYPEGAKQWASATGVLSRMNYAIALAGGRIPGVNVDLQRLFPDAEPAELVKAINQLVLAGQAEEETLIVLTEAITLQDKPDQRRQIGVALALGSPDFQRQ